MIRSIKIFTVGFFFCLLLSSSASGQTCGFGCLGLGGFYAGYSFQKYDSELLNNSFQNVNTSSPGFGTAKGFRLGANLFRTKYKSFLFTFKGYYQFLNEEKTINSETAERTSSFKNSLDLNYWGIGFDTGLLLLSFMDLKLLDAQVTFHTAKLTITEGSEPDPGQVFKSSKTKIGFQLGSGFIFHLAGDYISLETTAAYSKFAIDQLANEADTPYSSGKFIEKGGLNLVVQLNVGIPLY